MAELDRLVVGSVRNASNRAVRVGSENAVANRDPSFDSKDNASSKIWTWINIAQVDLLLPGSDQA